MTCKTKKDKTYLLFIQISVLCYLFIPHLNYLQHLCPADVAVPVQVIHAEGPAQLLLKPATRSHAQGDDELPEIDGGVAVGVKCTKDMLSKL